MYPQIFGKYVLERELARGGMARVILATLRGAGGFEKKLVVKQIRDELSFDQQFVRRFVEEAKTTVALSHPNIVPVYELGVEQGTYFLAMELVEGVSVAELLRERNPDGSRRVLSPEEGAYVGVEVCRALDYAHRRMKVVHRDITPRNVMIDVEGQIKLIDFGIAAPAFFAGHEILGSPGHMAPEQVDGDELGPPTDIFAVAVLLMEAWTGEAPFRRATPEECAAAVREAHPLPSTFDPRLVPIDDPIRRAMNLDPKQRQQEASELGRELRGFLQGVDVADLARALGDRVHALREELSASVVPPSLRNVKRASAASHGELGTKTFAAREEALGWSSIPPRGEREGTVRQNGDAGAPSTRQLAESVRSQDVSGPSTSVVGARATGVAEAQQRAREKARLEDPAMAIPTPLMVDVEELERIHANLAKAAEPQGTREPSGRDDSSKISAASPDRVETIATRPFETPVRSHERPKDGGAEAPPKRRATTVLVAAAFVALGALALWRVRTTGRIEPGAAHGSLPVETSVPSSTPRALASEVAPVPRTSGARPSARPFDSVPASASTSTSTSSTSAIAVGRSTLALQGEPGTRVWVDGVARGNCPTRVALEAGAHEVRFTFEPTSETITQRVTVKSGEQVTVQAQFTGATPTVKIQR